jgi:hypothetical protein
MGAVSVLGGLLFVLAVLVAVVYARVRVPDVARLSMPTATRYEYSDGTVFYTAGLQNRVIVPLSQVPPVLRQAVVAVENPSFWSDAGISPRGIARALANDVRGRPLEGGSTITQQFVKNAYLTDQQTLTRKLSEIFIAVKITRAYSKRQILADYLNTVYFGRGSYGADAAARAYFGVPVSAITDPARAAYLAALVNEPTVLSSTGPAAQARLRQRWRLVLDDMVKAGTLTRTARAAVRWPAVRPLAAAFAVFGDGGTYHDLAMALSVTVNGHRVWTFRPHGTPALGPLAIRILSIKDLNLGIPATAGNPVARYGGVPGTIGGDRSAWYTGLAGGAVTSVALWDTQPGPHGVPALEPVVRSGRPGPVAPVVPPRAPRAAAPATGLAGAGVRPPPRAL